MTKFGDIHLAPGDSIRITVGKPGDPVCTLSNGDRVYVVGGCQQMLRARTREEAFAAGLSNLLRRKGRVTKQDLRDVLYTASAAERQADLT